MQIRKPRLLFISQRHLVPADSGGKIRTRDVLMGLKGGAFEVTLTCPCSPAQAAADKAEIDKLCDHFAPWTEEPQGRWHHLTRLRHVLSSLPIPVKSEDSAAARQHIDALLQGRDGTDKPDVVVVDFPHAGLLVSNFHNVPAVLFTHNVEAEIFRRHAKVASNPLVRALWRNQTRKMEQFECNEMSRYRTVIAIAERDREAFANDYGVRNSATIPTGVNLDIYSHQLPPQDGTPTLMFSGSMDWLANIDAMEYFMDEVWSKVAAQVPDAQFTVIGRNPPERLVQAARERKFNWTFTGFVDSVQPYIRASQVSVIPLRVGGGTRLKVYESMAMGCPVVSTSIGVEGLPIHHGQHYLCGDTADDFANHIVALLRSRDQRNQLSQQAWQYVEENFSHQGVARIFERICLALIA